MFVIATIKLDPVIESAGDSNFESRFTCIILCVSEWYAPVSFRVLGADVGVRRGFSVRIFSKGWYIVRIVPLAYTSSFVLLKPLVNST